jgi:hypothetical protein
MVLLELNKEVSLDIKSNIAFSYKRLENVIFVRIQMFY